MKILLLPLLTVVKNDQIASSYKRENAVCMLQKSYLPCPPYCCRYRKPFASPKVLFFFPHCTFKNTKLSHALKEKELFRYKLTIFDEMLLSLMKKVCYMADLG